MAAGYVSENALYEDAIKISAVLRYCGLGPAPSASTGEHCICIVSDLLWLGLVWSCFVFCLLFLLFCVICAPVLTEGTVVQN